MARTKRVLLIQGDVAPTLMRLTGPMLIGILTMVAFNLADTYFIGQLGTQQLAAMSFTFPVVLLVASLAMGVGVGASAVISRSIGEGNQDKVRRLTTDALGLALGLVIIFTTIGQLTIDPLFTVLGATPKILPFIREYMSVWYVAVLFLVIPMVGNSAIRATGDTKTPAFIMMFAAAINIIMDPILIFGVGRFEGLGIQGAAYATAVSRAATLVASVWVLYYREQMLSFMRPRLCDVLESWRGILYIGLPAAATQMLIPISLGIITGLIATYGAPAVAAFGVASRVEMFGLAIVMALSAVLTPFVGQNWGAGRMDRVRLGVRYGQGFTILWGIVLFVILGASGRPIGRLFNDDPIVVQTLTTYLWIVPISYGLQGVLLVTTATLNALNRPLNSAALSALRLVGLYVPFAFAGSLLFDLPGIFVAAALANVVAGITSWVWLRRILGAEEESVPVVSVPGALEQGTD